MAGGFANPIVGGKGDLVYPAVYSPNFDLSNPLASPTPSWAILKSGLAYFFGLVLSGGTITGPDYIINTSGIFIYSGTPALGNLIGSWTTAGADGFGNTCQPNLATYGPGSSYTNLNTIGGNTGIAFRPGSITHSSLLPQLAGGSLQTGLVNEQESLFVTSGKAGGDDAAIQLFSESADATIQATLILEFGGFDAVTMNRNTMNIAVPVTATAGTAASPTLVTTDTWHAISMAAGWSTLATYPVPSYQLLPHGWVGVSGLAAHAAFSVNTALSSAALPAAYRPLTNQFIAAAEPGAAGLLIDTSGNLTATTGASTGTVSFTGAYPLNL